VVATSVIDETPSLSFLETARIGVGLLSPTEIAEVLESNDVSVREERKRDDSSSRWLREQIRSKKGVAG
jgi:hypothetical protein